MAPLIELDDIASTLELGSRSHVALVGGGGKSTLMLALSRALAGRIVLTTTVKMGADQHGGHRVLIDPADDDVVAASADAPVVVWSRVDGQKATGIDPARCDRIARRVDHLVAEADGSRRQPFKAPASYEPVIPSTATHAVGVMGIEAIGKVIADRCHRPMRVAALAGVSPYERLTVEGAAKVLSSHRGQRDAVPPSATYIVVVTKVGPEELASFEDLAERLDLAGVKAVGVRYADRSTISALTEP